MSEIVLRCPHCGTTQGAPGECHACSDAEVRYFCRNHDPGRWLDGATCPACGARFGAERRPSPQPRRPTRPPEARPIPATRSADRIRARRKDRERPPDAEPPPSLRDVLERVLGSGRRRRDDSEPSEGPWESPSDVRLPDLRLPTLRLKQFLLRLLLMGFVFVALVIVTMLFFVAGVVQTFGGTAV